MNNRKNGLHWLEIAFFLSYFLLFRIGTGIELALNSPNYSWAQFRTDMPPILAANASEMLAYWLLYRYLIKELLLERKYLAFSIGMVVFFLVLDRYNTFWRDFYKYGDLGHAFAQFFYPRWKPHFMFSLMLQQTLVLLALAYFVRTTQLEARQAQTELAQLKAQLKPHFFFNTLNTIYSFALERSEKTAPLVAGHADVMRYMLYRSEAERAPLAEEVKFIRNYLQVEQLRYERIKVDMEVQGITDEYAIEPLLLFPFVENAFKHGAADEAVSGFINIAIIQLGSELTFKVTNSRPAIKQKKTGGIGLANAHKRLALLYKGQHQLETQSDVESWSAQLVLNLRSL